MLPYREKDVLTVILAGGRGERLSPLTAHRAKPAVPFGGVYRIIDFTLSNCINSGLRRIVVLVQYKSLSLTRHLHEGWNFLSRTLDEFIDPVPPQMRTGDSWYRGTADAIFQNLYLVQRLRPKLVLVLSGDHIYKMNYAEMLSSHVQRKAALTVATIEVDRREASSFGVLEVDEGERIIGFEEKPKDPRPVPGDPSKALASMGIYVFDTEALGRVLEADAAVESSSHDFGKNIIPSMIGREPVYSYNFRDENKAAAKYWRDVGTLDAYWQASMDLVQVTPELNLYDHDWPIHTFQPQGPPPKFVFAQSYEGGRMGVALDSMISQGCIISGGRVQNSILSPWVRVNSYARVEGSILLEGVEIGRHARIRNAIIDKNVRIPDGAVIGFDTADDRQRFAVSPGGIAVVSARMADEG
ncbi:MAG TPA: glucose-1-phosphate adenylyltransferase [Planctomycetota bacterium]|nr:glucose-1-phosphate adenylyltransferase [Planctomycetota bacterium]